MQFLKGSLGPEEAACVLINSNFTTFPVRSFFSPLFLPLLPFLFPQLYFLFILFIIISFLPSRGDESPSSEAGPSGGF